MFPQKKVLRKNYFGKFFLKKSRPIPPLQKYRKIVSEVYVCQAKWAYKQKKVVKKVVFSCYFRKKINEEKIFFKKFWQENEAKSLAVNSVKNCYGMSHSFGDMEL